MLSASAGTPPAIVTASLKARVSNTVWPAVSVPAPPLIPVPETDTVVTVGAVVASVKVNDAVPVLPAESVSLATIVCAPCARPVGVNDQAPLAFAVVVPRTVAPSVSVTTALGSPVPLSVGFEVTPSVDEAPVSTDKVSVTAGAIVSTVTFKTVEGALALPAMVSVAVKLWGPFTSAPVV